MHILCHEIGSVSSFSLILLDTLSVLTSIYNHLLEIFEIFYYKIYYVLNHSHTVKFHNFLIYIYYNLHLLFPSQGDLYRMVGADTVYYGNMLRDDIVLKEIYMRDHCN